MEFKIGYDDSNPLSIEAYAKNLIGKTFTDILNEDKNQIALISEDTQTYGEKHENKNRKGGLGELIEERFFHYKCNNDSNPDFETAGVELKVTPYKINKNGSLSAKERLIITMIDYFNDINEDFFESHLWLKCRLTLLVYYLHNPSITNRLDYTIDFVKLFTPSEEDLEIIKHDYETIIAKIKAGKAHELSEGDTLYLGAATKAANSIDRRNQPFSDIPAKPRAFSFKNSYMTYVLNNFIVPGKVTYEPILKEKVVDFENYIIQKIISYKNYSVDELCKKFNVVFDKQPKNLEAMLAYRILGIKGNRAEEFTKANIVIKTIRISNKNTIKENMSFPTFKFKELVEEEWESATINTYLSETRFLFIVYKFDKNNILRLQGCQFWNIPYKDLHEDIYSVWSKTKQVLLDGIQITKINNKNYNNLPKSSENRVSHVRPHAINANDTYELPTGGLFPKQCFWLNNSYILSQLNTSFLLE